MDYQIKSYHTFNLNFPHWTLNLNDISISFDSDKPYIRPLRHEWQRPNSNVQNSSYQREVVNVAKPIIEEEMDSKFDKKSSLSPNSFRIADFGAQLATTNFQPCKSSPKLSRKNQKRGRDATSQIPDFHVSFNDQITNDFNTLFNSLPSERQLSYTAKVPVSFMADSFQRRPFILLIAHVPLTGFRMCPRRYQMKHLWRGIKREFIILELENKFLCVFESVCQRYRVVFGSKGGGVDFWGTNGPSCPCSPVLYDFEATFTTPTEFDLLGSCLVGMAKKGKLTEAKVDSFKFPLYFAIPQELKAIIERNRSFTIERIEILKNPGKKPTLTSFSARSMYLRAVFEGLMMNHFGSVIMDELFERYTKKLEASSIFADPSNEKSIIVFVLLKRKFE